MADYNVDTLENKIVVEAQEALKELEKIIGSVDKAKNSLKEIKNSTGLKSVSKDAKDATSSLTKMQLVGKELKKVLNFSGLLYAGKKTFDFISKATQYSIDYIETLNLFEVSMGKTLDQFGNLDSVSSKYYTKALKFQKDLNKAFGTNIEETMRYQALYNQMAQSMGIGDNASYIMSENLTKLGIDLASLFNKEESATMEALRAGVLAGQTKPLRNYGLDVTQQSLKPLVEQLGLDRGISELSQAEKMILRYIAVLKQASAAHGDFAKTIESPSNQLKIFKQQFAELKTAVGNLVQGLLGQILPYINGAIMAIKELIKLLGTLLGFEVTSQSQNLAQTTGVDDLDEGLSSAVGSAKELKAQLMDFDNIHNITTDTSTGGGGISTSPNGIDSKLLDALGEYDNLMGKVKMKATEIRDKILEWLGFTKQINPLTGDITWELGEGLTNFEKILDVVKAIGIAIGSWKVSRAITRLLDSLGIMKGTQAFTMAFGFTLGITGIYLAYKGTEHLLDGDVDIFSILETCLGIGAGTFGLVSILNSTKYGKLFYTGEKIKMGLGVMLGIQGFQVFAEGLDKDNITMQIGGILESAFGGYLIGSQIGGWKIGLTVALVVSVANIAVGTLSEQINTLKEIGDSMWEPIDEILERNKSIPEYIENLKAQKEQIQKNTDASLTQIEYTRSLVTELESLMDEHGKVYSGYESRASFILNQLNEACDTEYSLVGNQITRNGELVKSYDDIKNSIIKIVEAKKNQILLEANEEAYALALKNRMGLYQKVQQAETDFHNAVVEMQEQKITKNKELTEKEREALRQLENNLESAKKAYQDNTRDIIYYEDLQAAIIEGDTEKINNAVSNMTSVYETEQGKVSASLSDRIRDAQMFAKDTKVVFDELGKDIDEQTQARLDASVRALADGLAEQTKTIESLTPDQKEAWKLLATGSHEIYVEELSKLDPEVRTELQNMVGIIGEKTPDVQSKVNEISSIIKGLGADFKIAPNIDIDPKVSLQVSTLKKKLIDLRDSISGLSGGIVGAGVQAALNASITKLKVLGYAEGGMPDMGEIFMAREAGPELVGRIGRRTAVANNDQIVEAVSKGVYEAVISAMPNASTIQLDIRADEGIIVKKASEGFREHVMQTGELPFPVPV